MQLELLLLELLLLQHVELLLDEHQHGLRRRLIRCPHARSAST
ncbi:hypothetical protein [Jiangella endophytica]|nr:hypothetical protein [Jiangella endophytica]